jgi:hypothetical protein
MYSFVYFSLYLFLLFNSFNIFIVYDSVIFSVKTHYDDEYNWSYIAKL